MALYIIQNISCRFFTIFFLEINNCYVKAFVDPILKNELAHLSIYV